MKIPSPSYALTLRLRYPDEAGLLGRLTSLIGETDGYIGAVDIVEVRKETITRDFTINTSDVAHGEEIVKRIRGE